MDNKDLSLIFCSKAKHIRNNFSLPDDNIITYDQKKFANGELYIKLKNSVRGKNVFIVQGFNSHPSEDLMELFLMIDTANAASASTINVILPMMYGSRQDRKTEPRTPITISTIAKLLKSLNVSRVLTIDLHSPQSASAFYSLGMGFDNITTFSLFHPKMQEITNGNYVIVSPDVGGLPRARVYAEALGLPVAFADKRRDEINQSMITNFVGKVKGKNCIIVDDIVDTGGSLIGVAEALKENNAKEVNVFISHLVLSKNAKQKLNNAESIDRIYGSDTITHNDLPEKFEILSVSKILENIILQIYNNNSVSKVLQEDI